MFIRLKLKNMFQLTLHQVPEIEKIINLCVQTLSNSWSLYCRLLTYSIEDFERKKAHYSNIYYGASLKALINLGRKKNYIFIGCNSAGNNAYFIKSSLENRIIKEIKIEQGFVHSKFRESRDENGHKNFLNFEEEKKILNNLNFQSLD